MCSKLLSFLVSVVLCQNVLLCFWATVSALVCSSTVVRNDDDDDDELLAKNKYKCVCHLCNKELLTYLFIHDNVLWSGLKPGRARENAAG